MEMLRTNRKVQLVNPGTNLDRQDTFIAKILQQEELSELIDIFIVELNLEKKGNCCFH